jgi:hypothetical protein
MLVLRSWSRGVSRGRAVTCDFRRIVRGLSEGFNDPDPEFEYDDFLLIIGADIEVVGISE